MKKPVQEWRHVEAKIEFPDGSLDTFFSFDLDVLMDALEADQILSFTISKPTKKIAPNPLKKQPK